MIRDLLDKVFKKTIRIICSVQYLLNSYRLEDC